MRKGLKSIALTLPQLQWIFNTLTITLPDFAYQGKSSHTDRVKKTRTRVPSKNTTEYFPELFQSSYKVATLLGSIQNTISSLNYRGY